MKRWFGLVAVLLMMAWPTVAEQLPRVLIIGDSVYTQYCRGLTAEMKGKATVEFAAWPDDAVANSSNAVAHTETLLGYIDRNGKPVPEDKRPKWDMIHVNVGLGDLIHRVPNMKDFRILPIDAGGVIATAKQDYRSNLDTLIARLKATGATVIWASTTPIRASTSKVFKLGTEVQYNAIAAEVMAKHGVATNDMYGYIKHLINMDKPAGHGADPFNFDKKPIHMPVVREIERVFGLKPMPETEEEKSVKAAKQSPAPEQG